MPSIHLFPSSFLVFTSKALHSWIEVEVTHKSSKSVDLLRMSTNGDILEDEKNTNSLYLDLYALTQYLVHKTKSKSAYWMNKWIHNQANSREEIILSPFSSILTIHICEHITKYF